MPFRTSGRQAPLFCVAPITGLSFPYRPLAAGLADRPVYAIESRGLAGGLPRLRMEDIARENNALIEEVTPRGPLHLMGWSFGGLAAYEMARQLAAQGRSVASLSIVDTPPPPLRDWFSNVSLVKPIVLDTAPYARDYLTILRKAEGSRLRRLARAIGQLLPLPGVFGGNLIATARYQPDTYRGRVILLRTGEPGADSSWGWEQWVPEGVEVHRIPGNHMTALRPPHVQTLIQTLDRALRETPPQAG